jgi:hypothetical protein
MWLPVLCLSTKRVFILDYKMYVLSFLRAWRLSQDALVDADLREGFDVERNNERDSLYKHVTPAGFRTSEFDQALSLPNPHQFAVSFTR